MQQLPASEFSQLRTRAGLSIDEVRKLGGYSQSTIYRWERGEVKARKAAVELLQRIIDERHQQEAYKINFRFIDLFAGIGGLRRGFEPLGGECVFTSEWDRYSQLTYKANYICQHEVAGDITKIEAEEVPEHDLLLAGFPCQPFSLAGVSKKNALGRQHGFRCESQGTLFFDVARIIAHHRPRAFLLENVKNLVNHDKGRTFEVIHQTLTQDLGYQVHWKVIDARSWVPQHRERIFIVGFRDANDFSFADFAIPDPMKGPKLGSILHPGDGSEGPDRHYTAGKDHKVSDRYILTQHLWQYLQDYAQKHRERGNGFGFGLVGEDDVTRTLSARYFKDGSEILVARGRGVPRRLTPRECARLMGFDKPNGSDFKIPVSDTQAYRQFGNAVVVPVVQAVAQHMAPWLAAGADSELHQRRLLLAV